MRKHPKRFTGIAAMFLVFSLLASCGSAADESETYDVAPVGDTISGNTITDQNVYTLKPGEGSFESDQTEDDTSGQNPSAPYASDYTETDPFASEEDPGDVTIISDLPTDDNITPELEDPEPLEGEVEEPSKIKSAVSGAKRATLLKNDSTYYYYYTKLTKDEKKIYKGLKSVFQYPDSTERGTPILISLVPASSEFNDSYWNAYYALMYDHPEFYFGFQRVSFAGIQYYRDYFPDADGFYEVQFVLAEPYKNYKKELTAFNKAVKKIMNSLDLTQSDVNIALQIHDKLMAACSYDYDACGDAPTYARTAYSALVTHDPICAGYAFAFTYLMQQAGLKAIVVSGDAGSTKADASGHMWNLVKIGAQWYEVDVTWDDIEPGPSWYNSPAGAALAKDAAAMYKVTHRLFMVPTYYINNYKYSNNYKYTVRSGSWIYSFIPFGNSVHLRTSASVFPAIDSKAPKAYGEYYLLGRNCGKGAAIDTLVDDGQVFAESNERKLTNDDLKLLRKNKYHSAETMTKMAINELYARRKYIFTSSANVKFYKGYHWYDPKTHNKKAVQNKFNKYEEYNLKVLKKFLAKLE